MSALGSGLSTGFPLDTLPIGVEGRGISVLLLTV